MSTNTSGGILGSNAAPISFPGIASGVDYNSIIEKLTSLTLAPNVTLNAQIATLNAANVELIKINGLLQSVQNALGELSDPALFETYGAVSSNTGVATATGLPSLVAASGTYTILSQSVATSTQIESNPSVGYLETDTITSGTYAGDAADTVPLADSYAAVEPTNGSASTGTITVDGQQISYNVDSQSINQIFTNIAAAVNANYDAGFTINFEPGTDTVEISGTKPITLGSSTDSGNLLQVLKLDEAQVNNSGPTDSVVGTSGVGGISSTLPLNGSTSAGFLTPVTSGFFTINGVQIQVSATGDNVDSILAKINASGAGVTATYDQETNEITLTNSTTGAESIVVGAAGDTSNFLKAAGLTSATGATTIVGQQSSVTLETASGGQQTIYSNSNSITDAIPGIQLDITADVGPPDGSPYTITVSQNTNGLISAIGAFQTAYNAAISEINSATAPPVVTSSALGTLNAASSSTALGAGVLYGRADISQLKDDLTDLVSGFLGNQTKFDSGSYTGTQGSYNSLSSIGLSLNDSFTELTSSNDTGADQNSSTSSTSSLDPSTAPGIQNTTLQGTDGTLAALNVTQFLAAYAADPTGVQSLLQGTSGLATMLGTTLTAATGTPTLLDSGPVGNIPTVSFMTGFEDQVNDQIASLQDQVAQITDNANAQANLLRAQFVTSDTLIGEYSSLQSELSGFFQSAGS